MLLLVMTTLLTLCMFPDKWCAFASNIPMITCTDHFFLGHQKVHVIILCIPISGQNNKVALVIQQTFSIVMIRYSMHQDEGDEEGNHVKYLKTTAVVVAELLKVLFSIFLFYAETGESVSTTAALIYNEVFVEWKSTLKLAIPALLYTLQNNTIFVALNNLPGLVYQISSQGKEIVSRVVVCCI